MTVPELLKLTERGLYCPAGDFYIDPWRGVDRALITHAHADHARSGSKAYLSSPTCKPLLEIRLSSNSQIESVPFGQPLKIGDCTVSFHPAGHLLGSAQIRVEHKGVVWVVTGDYKREKDNTCEPFEVVPCHGLITETTFGLPIYRWKPQHLVFEEINQWWRENQSEGRTSMLFGYSLGKAQRLLGGVDRSIGPILIHGALEKLTAAYLDAGIDLPTVLLATPENAQSTKGKALVVAPPSALSTPWAKKFEPFSTAFASGWMSVRGRRRSQSLDRGFVLSDHVDWPSLIQTVEESGAETVWTTHGYADVVARFLNEQGINSVPLQTSFTGEGADDDAEQVLAEAKEI